MTTTEPSVYQCANCRTVVADSYSLKKADRDQQTLFFTAVVDDEVVEENKFFSSSFSKYSGCVYAPFHCKCKNMLGRKYLITPPECEDVRNCYCIFEENVFQYVLKKPAELTHLESSQNQSSGTAEEIYVAQCAVIKTHGLLTNLIQLFRNKHYITQHEIAAYLPELANTEMGPPQEASDHMILEAERSVSVSCMQNTTNIFETSRRSPQRRNISGVISDSPTNLAKKRKSGANGYNQQQATPLARKTTRLRSSPRLKRLSNATTGFITNTKNRSF